MSEDKAEYEKEKQNLLDKLNNSERQVAFLFGSGVSVPAKLPIMDSLTTLVEAGLTGENAKKFKHIKEQLAEGEHIEHILNFLENITSFGKFDKFLTGEVKGEKFSWSDLNVEIRKQISKVVNDKVELKKDTYTQFAKWIGTRERNTEIYTLNYDLVIESAFEASGILYYDGFVGGVSPMFQPSTVDPVLHDVSNDIRPPSTWTRLWKMHGSVNWIEEVVSNRQFVRRSSNSAGACLIYPSTAKYTESRRSPFLLLQDKFRRHLNAKNLTLVISGYGFGDEHINEILIDSINRNKRLDVVVLSFTEIDSNKFLAGIVNEKSLNISIFAPTEFYCRGIRRKWSVSEVLNLGDVQEFFKILGDCVNVSEEIKE
jgi:hypothetical protein